MMRTYVRVVDGFVVEVIPVLDFTHGDGAEYTIEERYHPEIAAQCVETTGFNPTPQEFWSWNGSVFIEPITYAPTSEEILAKNTERCNALLSKAALAIDPLHDAVDLNDATPGESALLRKWKEYRVAVNRIDLTQIDPAWPSSPSDI